MGTVVDFFNTDQNHAMRVTSENKLQTADGIEVQFKMFQDFSAGSIYPVLCVPPAGCRLDVLSRLIEPETLSVILGAAPGLTLLSDGPGSPERKSSSLKFLGHVYLYTQADMGKEDLEKLQHVARTRGLVVECCGPTWAHERSTRLKPEAFLSHDARDKEAIARPLAWELGKLGVPVWFDEFSLKVGDSLREKIETGLKECKRCILVLSPHFLANAGWTKREFDSIFTRELLDNRKVVLPIWAGVTKRDVYEYSPSLADRFALMWERGLAHVAGELAVVLKHGG